VELQREVQVVQVVQVRVGRDEMNLTVWLAWYD
jgi:hypothetical protein